MWKEIILRVKQLVTWLDTYSYHCKKWHAQIALTDYVCVCHGNITKDHTFPWRSLSKLNLNSNLSTQFLTVYK